MNSNFSLSSGRYLDMSIYVMRINLQWGYTDYMLKKVHLVLFAKKKELHPFVFTNGMEMKQDIFINRSSNNLYAGISNLRHLRSLWII